mmetsp:Transcript_8102/g.16357  ORF Transcript_8102/g.16357 Transcript_8102/m.16357 type:complete len:271 (-) Transcript_8102:1579-2391(-)
MQNVSEAHQDQIIKFIKFFRSKRDVCLEQIQADFDDTKNDAITEDMYTNEEVLATMDSMCNVVKDTSRSEVGRVINMSVLILAQIFEEAEEQDAELTLDTSKVENQTLLEEVEKMRLDKSASNKKTHRLKDTLEQTKKELMQAESDRDLYKGKYDKAKRKLAKQEKKLAQLGEEKEQEQEQEEAKGEEQEQEEEKGGEDVNVMGPDPEGMSKSQLQSEVQRLRKELDGRLAQCKPFLTMKKMMGVKNNQLMAVRRKLEKWEPDFVMEEDM